MLFLFSFKMNLSPFMDTCTKTLTKAGRANSNQATVMIGGEWEKKKKIKPKFSTKQTKHTSVMVPNHGFPWRLRQ